jgi:hypothetical protein
MRCRACDGDRRRKASCKVCGGSGEWTPLPIIETGDTVYYPSRPQRFGKVVNAGPEQSEVKWSDGFPENTKGHSYEINRYLRKVKVRRPTL